MKPSDMDADMRELLDQIERENDMRMAYIAGVGKGIELVARDKQRHKSDFNKSVRGGFQDFVEEYDD